MDSLSVPPAGRPLRRLPGIGGVAVGFATGLMLSRSSADAVDDWLSLAGVSLAVAPSTFAIAGGMLAAVVGWAVLYLLWGPGGWLDRPVRSAPPARPPLSFADLGPPPPPRREQPLPTDLDQPLSAFDPDAMEFYQQKAR